MPVCTTTSSSGGARLERPDETADRSHAELMPGERVTDLEARLAALQRRHDRLRNRRSVRLALALADGIGRLRTRPVPEPPVVTESKTATAEPTDAPILLDVLRDAPPVTVVIPAYRAAEALGRCLDSVVRHTSSAERILVIDDASSDRDVDTVIQRHERRIDVLRNDQNLGFVATANRGFAETRGDVILLNADTQVGPRWVERLRLAAYSQPAIATVTPFSDSAGAFSAPVGGQPNPLPEGVDAAAAARLVARGSDRLRPPTPTANGFCMYVKRQALEDVGLFDVDAYPRGYGEENDWSMRAGAMGWRHVIDDASYVLHERSASFGSEKEALAAAGSERLRRDHPGYAGLVEQFLASPALETARARVGESLRAPAEPVRPRVLYILHGQRGGTPETSRDLAAAISKRYEAFVMRSDGRTSVISDANGLDVLEHRLRRTVQIGEPCDPAYRDMVTRFLVELDVDVLHVRHLMNHGLDAPAVARTLEIPVVMSVHDFYLVCPTAHLIDHDGRYCGGRCTPGQGECPAVPWVAQGPHLKHEWVHVWRDRASRMLRDVDVAVAAHPTIRELFSAMLPNDLRWQVIEHGRDLVRHPPLPSTDVSGRPIRLLLTGSHGLAKGSEFVQAVRAQDAAGSIEFHLLGEMWPDSTGVIDHGPYGRSEYAERVRAIAPDAVLVPSITPESYCHVLTEAWAAGCPVIATDRGAPAERIRRTGAGVLIDPDDAGTAYGQILAAFESGAIDDARARLTNTSWPTTAEMADRYADLYDELVEARLTARSGS